MMAQYLMQPNSEEATHDLRRTSKTMEHVRVYTRSMHSNVKKRQFWKEMNVLLGQIIDVRCTRTGMAAGNNFRSSFRQTNREGSRGYSRFVIDYRLFSLSRFRSVCSMFVTFANRSRKTLANVTRWQSTDREQRFPILKGNHSWNCNSECWKIILARSIRIISVKL